MEELISFLMYQNITETYTLGVDIGGTKIDTALVGASGEIIANYYRFVDPSKNPEKAISDIIDSVRICLKESGKRAAAIGVGVAGQIDKTNGLVRRSPNLPDWRDVPLRERLEEALQIPVIVNNDVRIITWGEWQHGAGKGVNDLVCLFLGTGVGGGVVTNGQLLEGCHNTAGELGHMTIVAGGRKCRCPNEGCLEAYVGGWALADRAKDAVQANPQAGITMNELAGGRDKISAITVSQAYNAGDPLAQRIIKDTVKYLAAGIVTIVNIFNPCLIILGGSVIQGLPDIVPAVDRKVRELALQTPVESLRITTAALGNKAGVIGAAALARNIVK
jgi:glucokinase